ncbi:MAG: dihydropteroate synthase [Culicoidibacterales bacterium]
MQIMGILNVTPDSFSDGGAYFECEMAIAQAQKLLAAGATIIDVGGETTRPGATPVSTAEELQRVIPVIEALTQLECEISIDTYKAEVAQAAILAGATYINDVSGALYDPLMKVVAAKTGVPIILMHNRFQPGQTPHAQTEVEPYHDLYGEIKQRLQLSVDTCLQAGVKPEQIILDPGIGFAKTAADNEQLLQKLAQLRSELGYPFLLGGSRKRFLGPYLSEDTLQQRDVATAVLSIYAQQSGCEYVRVHDVASTTTAIQMWELLQR